MTLHAALAELAEHWRDHRFTPTGEEEAADTLDELLAKHAPAPRPERVTLTDDDQANTCGHGSASGIDATPVSDPGKVWRCDHCGLRWSESEPLRWSDADLAAREAALREQIDRERAAADYWFDLDIEHPEYDDLPEPSDMWRIHRDLRAARIVRGEQA